MHGHHGVNFFRLVEALLSVVAQLVKNLPVMQEAQVRSPGCEDALERGMATLSSILAWRISWTEEPGGLPCMGSQSQKQLSDFLFSRCRTAQECAPDTVFCVLSVQFSSVAQSCPTLCDPMNRSTPGLPVHHQLPEFTQTHVHRVGDAIQPPHPLSSPSPPAPNPSQHQALFQ